MAEEKERGFKVEDRRRFSPEGELKPEHRASGERPAAEQTGAAAGPTGAAAGAEPRAQGEAVPPPEITFSTFIVGLSTQALAQLGEIPDPLTGEHARNLPAAQQLIDILGMLKEKTHGNLKPEEQGLLDAILFDLRMKYVEIARLAAG